MSTPPRSIQHLVRDNGSVTLTSPYGHDFMVLVGLVLGAIAGLGFTWSIGGPDWVLLGFIATVCGVLFGSMLGWWASKTRRSVTISPGMVKLSGPFAPQIPLPTTLVVDAPIGREHSLMGISRDDIFPIAEMDVPKDGTWSYDAVTWTAEHCATLLAAELIDHRDEADWTRWATDANYRIDVDFDVRLEDNAIEFPSHHATDAAPTHHESVDMDGMSVMLYNGFFSDTVLEIDGRNVSIEGQKLPLSSITRAGVFFHKVRTKNSTHYYGTLKVLSGHKEVSLSQLGVTSSGGEYAGALLWAAERIREAAAKARQEHHGTAHDVPEALKALSGRAPEAQ